MSLRVLQPGLATTVQDKGREGWLSLGVPNAGACDQWSLAQANAMLGNPPDAAALELTLRGGCYQADVDLALALAGAPMPARIDGPHGPRTLREPPCAFMLRKGHTLELGHGTAGARTYLAVAGGWRTPVVLGSRSHEKPLRAGDQLDTLGPSRTPARWTSSDWPVLSNGPEPTTLRVILGPEPLDDPAALLDAVFVVSAQGNRMGVRLTGPELDPPSAADRLSCPVSPGAVQIAGRQPLILGVACGTMGGYPHVAHVITADLPLIAQRRPGSRVRFQAVSLEQARDEDRRSRQQLAAWCLRVTTAARDPINPHD